MILETRDILRILLHRPPILMVERVLFLRPGRCGAGIRMIGRSDPWFATDDPAGLMPEMLCVEAIAQVGAIVLATGQRGQFSYDNVKYGVLASLPEMEIYAAPRPTRVISTWVEARRVTQKYAVVFGDVVADGRRVARGELGIALDLPEDQRVPTREPQPVGTM